MPIYEYSCGACGADFDQLVRADSEPACPWCESTALTRKLSTVALPMASGFSPGSSPSPPSSGGGHCCGGGCGCG
ncbi:MAG: zinc ribbon domain-containing protein [Gemmatimonadetes bacterium]|nr:zinc ribbon domain-containing protein [Gemmatimonadota bacterium]